jgi:surface antigen
MANSPWGRIVRVTTQRHGEGPPILEFYCVAESDLVMAESVIKVALASRSDVSVEAAELRRPAEIEALGLKRGEFTRVFHDSLKPLPPHLAIAAQGTQATGIRTIAPTGSTNASRWLFPLAASIAALAVGVAGGYLFRDFSGGYVAAEATSVDPLTAKYEATLQGSLDSAAAAGQSFTYDSPGEGQGKITLGRSFTTSYSHGCRDFSREEIRGTARSSGDGLACRAPDGSWSIMFFRGAS